MKRLLPSSAQRYFFSCLLTFLMYGIHFQSLTSFSFLSYHSQASLKKFLDYNQTGAIEKMAKILDKGLDPNFHDPDTGGEFFTSLCATSHCVYGFIICLQINDFASDIKRVDFYFSNCCSSYPNLSVDQRPLSLWPYSPACQWRASGCWFRAALTWTLEAEMA